MELPTWTFIDFMNLLDLMDFSGFQASIFGGQDPFHGSDFLPTSRRLQAKPLSMSGTLPNSNAVSFVPLLRLLQHASLWAISVPKICWMVFSLLLLLATALCFLALLSSSHRSKPGPCVLQLKALLCALMLLLDHLKLPDSFHTIVPIGSSSHDATAASSSPSPGQTASPMHPLDISFLLELPGDVVALGHDGGISHVKSAVSTLEPVWHAVPNTGEGDCFWLSLQDIVGPPGAARCKVAGWLQDHPNHPAHHEAALVAEAGLTTEWHVNATVQAYCASFPQGCFVFHQPSQCVVSYHPGSLPRVLSVSADLLRESCPCLLYTECPGSTGHFERLEKTTFLPSLGGEVLESKVVATASTMSCLPSCFGGMLEDGSQPPAIFDALIQVGVPPSVASLAAEQHPEDLRAALDFAFGQCARPWGGVEPVLSPPSLSSCSATVVESSCLLASPVPTCEPGGESDCPERAHPRATIVDTPSDDHDMFGPSPNIGNASHVFDPSHDSTTMQAVEASSHDAEAAAPLSRQISLPRPFACRCVGLYGSCVCGYLQRLNRRIKMGLYDEETQVADVFDGNEHDEGSLEHAPAQLESSPAVSCTVSQGLSLGFGGASVCHTLDANSCFADAILAQLLLFEVPLALAQDAAARYPHDINAALDWIYPSRREFGAECSTSHPTIDLCTQASASSSQEHVLQQSANISVRAGQPAETLANSSVPTSDSHAASFTRSQRRSRSRNLPRMDGAGLTPEACSLDEMVAVLLSLDVPLSVARDAAARYPNNIDSALDWACSSDRRHNRARSSSPMTIDLSTPPRASASTSVPACARPRVAGMSPDMISFQPGLSPLPSNGASLPSLTRNLSVPSSWVTPSSSQLPVPSQSHGVLQPPAFLRAPETPPTWSPLTPDANETEDLPAQLVHRMPPACFLRDPEAEVHSWFCAFANSDGQAALDPHVWERMPMYAQYIRDHTLPEVVADCLASIRQQRGLDMSIEQASRLPRVFGYTTILPLAVASEYLHSACGLPSVFVFDLFQACLASCQQKHLEVALYADNSKSFASTGDPNAGKSPACSFVLGAFEAFAKENVDLLYHDQHWIGVGNNNRIQERLRALDVIVISLLIVYHHCFLFVLFHTPALFTSTISPRLRAAEKLP